MARNGKFYLQGKRAEVNTTLRKQAQVSSEPESQIPAPFLGCLDVIQELVRKTLKIKRLCEDGDMIARGNESGSDEAEMRILADKVVADLARANDVIRDVLAYVQGEIY